MLGIPIGFLTANLTEWMFHKFVLHGLGKNKKSFWNFHWYGHHRSVRKLGMKDPDYNQMTASELLRTPEALSLLAGGSLLLPIASRFPWFAGTVWVCGIAYYAIHYYSHTNPKWAYTYLPWHVDHHLYDQEANFNVTLPLWDYILGTRRAPSTPEKQQRLYVQIYSN